MSIVAYDRLFGTKPFDKVMLIYVCNIGNIWIRIYFDERESHINL